MSLHDRLKSLGGEVTATDARPLSTEAAAVASGMKKVIDAVSDEVIGYDEKTHALLEEVESAAHISVDELLSSMGAFASLAASPKTGSLMAFANKPGVRKKDLEAYLSSKWLRNVVLGVFDNEVCSWTYSIYSLVLPHTSAIELAERVRSLSKEHKTSELEILSKLTGNSLQQESDILGLLRTVARRQPKLFDLLVSVIK